VEVVDLEGLTVDGLEVRQLAPAQTPTTSGTSSSKAWRMAVAATCAASWSSASGTSNSTSSTISCTGTAPGRRRAGRGRVEQARRATSATEPSWVARRASRSA